MALTFPQMPAWLVPDRPTWAQQSAQTHDLFSQAYQSARGEQKEKNMLEFQLQKQKEEDAQIAQKFSVISEALKNSKSPQDSWDIVSQHPEWLADRHTAPGVANYLKGQTEAAKAEVDTLAGKSKISDMTEFAKRAANLTAQDRSALQQIPGNQNGSISTQQWSKLAELETAQRKSATSGLEVFQVTTGPSGELNTTYKDPAEVKVQSPLGKLLSDRAKALASGNKGDVAIYDAEIAARGAKDGFKIEFDDQGRPIINYGPQATGIGKPTVATQSASQRKLLKYQAASELLNSLTKTITPETVGFRGVVGEMVLDRGLSQIYPEFANKERIDVRTGLVAARESLMREISDDTRFSNMDREEIAKALPSSGVFESAEDAKQRIAKVRSILNQRGKVYSDSLGVQPPLWTLSQEEIKALFQQQKISEDEAIDALIKFH